ncbi:MAG: hypothetical protein H7A00_02355 [Hahellaceae bacterium]|nr:hypothetical protein [Hahellaceae bacterium]
MFFKQIQLREIARSNHLSEQQVLRFLMDGGEIKRVTRLEDASRIIQTALARRASK